MILAVIGVSKATYPIAVSTGGVKSTIVMILVIASLLSLVIVCTWRAMASIFDIATHQKYQIVNRIKNTDHDVIRDRSRVGVVATAGLITFTILIVMFLPNIGSSSVNFQDLVNTYEINEITLTGSTQNDALINGGHAVRVDNLRGQTFNVTWYPTTGSMKINGTLQINNGRARLVSSTGKEPSLKTNHYDL
jgi:hypothetical protein